MSLSSAQERVEEYLKDLEAGAGDELRIVAEQTIECPAGWVFFFNSKTFIEMGDPKYALAGNGPLLVNKNTGDIVQLGTAYPVNDYIDHYEKTGTVLS